MEKRTEYLFYIGIQNQDEEGRLYHKATKQILSFYGGRLVAYGCFVPQELVRPSQKLWRWQRRRRERQRILRLEEIIREAATRAALELDGERITYFYAVEEVANALAGESVLGQESDADALTDRLCEAFLYRERQTNRDSALSLSLPKECGELTVRRLICVIEPYLPRMNEVLFVGTEDAGARMLEDYLYDEYGILMNYGRLPLRNTIWVDLDDTSNQNLSKYAKENGICHINRAEVLKFLDTAAKNGYNTKVN